MKKFIYLLIGFLISISSIAQTPSSFNYQAVLRSAEGQVKANEQVSLTVSIIKDSINGNTVYEEEWDVETNELGLVNLQIGTLKPTDFDTVNWSLGNYFLALSVDNEPMGVSQLLSVPFALHAKSAETVQNFSLSGNENTFENWDKNVADDFSGKYDSLTGAPVNVSAFVNDAGYLTEDSIPEFNETVAFGINASDTAKWNNKQNKLIGNEAIFDGWDKNVSDDFDGFYSSLKGRPMRLGFFNNDVGYITNPNDADADPTNELQVLSISNDTVYLSNGGFAKLPGETDPVYSAWDKSTGISITESQISDLDHYTDSDIDGTETAFDGWDKDASDDFDGTYSSLDTTGLEITESQISDLDHFTNSDETDPVYLADPAASITDAGSGAVITGTERTKLAGIADGAEVNVQADWSETDNTKDSYIANKPTNVSSFTNDAGYLTQDTTLDESEVDAFVANNGYQLSADDDDTDATNEIELPTQTGNSGNFLTTNGTSPSWAPLPGNTNAITSKSGNYTVTSADKYIICTSGITVTLPTAVGASGTEYIIKNMSSSNVTIATTGSQTIAQDANNNTTSATLGTTAQNNWIKVVSDGAKWISFRALY